MASMPKLESAPTEAFDLYTEYQRGFPRFRHRFCKAIHLIFFSDTFLHLDPLIENIIPPEAHTNNTYYSKEFADIVPANHDFALPLPYLRPFFAGAARRIQECGDCVSGMAVEQLIDGMGEYLSGPCILLIQFMYHATRFIESPQRAFNNPKAKANIMKRGRS